MTPPSRTDMSKETKRKSLVLHRLPQSQKPASSMDPHCHLLASACTHGECTRMPIHSHHTHPPHKLNLWASELVQIAAKPDNLRQSLGPSRGRKVILRLPHTHACKYTPNVTDVKQLGETRMQGKERRCGLTPNPGHTPKEMGTQAFTQQGSPSSQEDRTSGRFTKQTRSQVPE